jgi:hypothetical protein
LTELSLTRDAKSQDPSNSGKKEMKFMLDTVEVEFLSTRQTKYLMVHYVKFKLLEPLIK